MPASAAIATLIIALLLPWILGAALLASLPAGPVPGARARVLGYGFFLGYALLFLLVVAFDSTLGRLQFPALLGVLGLLTAAAVVTAWRRQKHTSRAEGRASSTPRPARVLLLLFFLLCALHLLAGIVEVLHRPVFPWDAWQSWMYRAKAWFHAGALLPMDSPADWARGLVEYRYAVEGNHYPRFVPVVGLWAALALGKWSETLVNLPYALLAVALSLAVYGQARALSLPRWGAVICCYVLLSLPLLGAHLSLAGQADAWMVGYTGLGFAALLCGLAGRDRSGVALGLTMVAFALCVKAEGKLWLLMALALCALVAWPRRALIALALGGAALVLAWFAGFHAVELPLLGRLGFVDGRLYLPLFGDHAFAPHNLSGTFAEHFVAADSWHLLWPLLALACAAALRLERTRSTLIPLAFLLLLVAAIVFIFLFTEQAQWAEDGTAMNRLPLQFAPALVIAATMLAAPLRAPLASLRLRPLAVAAACGFVLVSVLLLVIDGPRWQGPREDRGVIPAGELDVRVGSGYSAGGARVVSDFRNGFAVLSTKRQLNADAMPLLRLETRGDNRKHLTFFWRRAADPASLHSIDISGPRGLRWRNLADEPTWSGALAEVGLLLYDDGGRSLRIEALALYPETFPHWLASTWANWFEHGEWSMTSAHFLYAGKTSLRESLPLLVLAWLLLALVALTAAPRGRAGTGPALLVLAVGGWLLLDSRWLLERAWRVQDTVRHYPLARATALEYGDDATIQRLVQRAAASAADPARQPLLLTTLAGGEDRMELRRARYHALPRPAFVHDGPPATLPTPLAGDILVLRRRYGESAADATPARVAERTGEQLDEAVEVRWDAGDGFLLVRGK